MESLGVGGGLSALTGKMKRETEGFPQMVFLQFDFMVKYFSWHYCEGGDGAFLQALSALILCVAFS